jgi:hypothetical protein
MRYGISSDLEPLGAAADMPPPFPNLSFGISTVVKIICPVIVAHQSWVARSFSFGFTPADKLILIASATPWAGYL